MRRVDIGSCVAQTAFRQIHIGIDQFRHIQERGQCELSLDLKVKLSNALERYVLTEAIVKNASTLKDQIKTIEKAHEALTFLVRFMSDFSDHATYKPRARVEEELVHLKHAVINEGWTEDDWRVIDEYYFTCVNMHDLKDRLIENGGEVIDFKTMEQNLLLWEVAMVKAKKVLQKAVDNDVGGAEVKVSLNKLLLDLDEIYSKAKGHKGCFERFCTEAVSLLPDPTNVLPKGAGSIIKQVKRVAQK
jgi:hypothetical protein